ncbi:MAG: deoxyribodipyrimidine photo-lyase, partial [Granulosicoccus sp.]
MAKRFLRGIWWIKRDFRLNDNQALCQAIAECETVLPLFVIEPDLCAAEETSSFHYHAWRHAGQALDVALQACDNGLSLWVGGVCDVLDLLLANDGFDALYSHEETGSDITYARDKAVARWTRKHGVHWTESPQTGVIRGLTDRDKRQPIIRKRLMQTLPLSAPATIPAWKPERIGPVEAAQIGRFSVQGAEVFPLCLESWPSLVQFQQFQQ